jgi:hypothetical protein
MTDTKWRNRQRARNRCLHCKERAEWSEELNRHLTLCPRHLEIQRGYNQRRLIARNQDKRKVYLSRDLE